MAEAGRWGAAARGLRRRNSIEGSGEADATGGYRQTVRARGSVRQDLAEGRRREKEGLARRTDGAFSPCTNMILRLILSRTHSQRFDV